MTVDMLAAAFIWPEEILVGRTPVGDDLDPDRSHGSTPANRPAEPEPAPFWAALVRRFRAESIPPSAEAR